jgi:hypothetical protein
MTAWRRNVALAEVVAEDGSRVALLRLAPIGSVWDDPVILSGAGALIWGLLDGHRTEDDIVGELRCIPGAPAEDVLSGEVRVFLLELRERGLAERPD